jgi:hypothetical protein
MSKASNPQSIQPLGIAVYTAILTVVVCYCIKPDLIGIRSAFSSLGAFPPTSYIFTTGFVLTALLLLVDAKATKRLLQKICRIVAATGFFMLGVFQIEHGQIKGDLHRLGGLIMLLAIVVSMIAHVITEWRTASAKQHALYSMFTLLAITSVVMSVLSSSQFKVMALQGLAQYIGLVSLVGWAMLDSKQR